MEIWDRKDSEGGLSTALVGPMSMVEVVAALDPAAEYVLLPDFTPVQGAGWADVMVPLTPDRALRPDRAKVSRVSMNLLLPTAEFTEIAGELAEYGVLLLQFRTEPRPEVDYNDVRPKVRFERYKAAGLTVRIELPHARESALMSATNAQDLSAALGRLGLPAEPTGAQAVDL
jgi:hypothetical protein